MKHKRPYFQNYYYIAMFLLALIPSLLTIWKFYKTDSYFNSKLNKNEN